MTRVNVTELRNNLPAYLARIQAGEEIVVTLRGKAIARIESNEDVRKNARKKLLALSKKCSIGDILSPLNLKWETDIDNT